jgi:hypothetical protein
LSVWPSEKANIFSLSGNHFYPIGFVNESSRPWKALSGENIDKGQELWSNTVGPPMIIRSLVPAPGGAYVALPGAFLIPWFLAVLETLVY